VNSNDGRDTGGRPRREPRGGLPSSEGLAGSSRPSPLREQECLALAFSERPTRVREIASDSGLARQGEAHDLGHGGVRVRARARLVVAGHQERSARVRMTAAERQRYVHWWVRHSGLTTRQLRQIATAIWTDRLLDESTHGLHRRDREAQFNPRTARDVFWPGVSGR